LPIFEYRCLDCRASSERLVLAGDKLGGANGIGDIRRAECEVCGGDLERVPSAPAFEIHEVFSFDNEKVQAAVNKELALRGDQKPVGPGSPLGMKARGLKEAGYLDERHARRFEG
jgi:predicted nucleic acid-binding Zn ribbon protein